MQDLADCSSEHKVQNIQCLQDASRGLPASTVKRFRHLCKNAVQFSLAINFY